MAERCPPAWCSSAGLVVVGAIDWGTAIESIGMRVPADDRRAIVTARAAVSVHGAVPLRVPEGPSPDMLGVDRPLTRSDVFDAERALGLTEADLHGTA